MHSLDVAALGRLLSVQACVPSKNKSKQWKDISDTKFYFHYDTLFMFRISKLVKKETQCMSNLSVDWTCFNDSITQKLIFPHLGQVAHSGTWVYLIHVHLLVTHVGFLFGLHTSRMLGASKSMDFYIEKNSIFVQQLPQKFWFVCIQLAQTKKKHSLWFSTNVKNRWYQQFQQKKCYLC